MKILLRRLRPDHLAGQIALLIFAALVLFQLALAVAQSLQSRGAWRPFAEPYESLAAAIIAVDLAPPERRQAALAELARSAPWSMLRVTPSPPAGRLGADAADDLSEFQTRLWPGARLYYSNETNARGESAVVVGLRQGGYLLVATEGPRRPGFPAWSASWPTRVQRLALFFVICVTLLTLWISGAVVAPLVRLAREAERFPDESGARPPLAEAGPQEVRDLTRAVNRMQRRIEAMIAGRSQALAAISHDLRTIITRIKLRSEFIGDEALKSKMLADADLMDSMLLKNLQALRGGGRSPDRCPIDLDSVLQTVCDQFADLGHKVTYNGGRHQIILGSLTELQRLFTNLVENAVSHANEVVVTLTQPAAALVQVDVCDDGPGIPAADKARVLEPFVRGEPARTVTDRSGFGLGLSIVRSLVEELGGRLELLDHEPRGLVARVTLPSAFFGIAQRAPEQELGREAAGQPPALRSSAARSAK